MGDTGVACAVLGLDAAQLRRDRATLGPMLETFVYQELKRQASWGDVPVSFNHFRDRDGAAERTRQSRAQEEDKKMPEPSVDHDEQANLDAFGVRRDMIVHEDQLINARLTMLLLAQSFLVIAAAILLSNAHTGGNTPAFYWLTLLICGLSILLGILTNYSIAAARREQRDVLDAAQHYERVFPFCGPSASEWRLCLQSHTALTLRAGHGIASWFPKTTTIAWVGFVSFCLHRLFGWQVAAGASVATLLAVLAAFGYVSVRMRSTS